VALVGTANQIVELDSSGHELTRFGQQFTGTNNSAVPYDSPSGLAYLGTDLIVANQSYIAGNTANQALLNVETGEPGQPVYVPANAGLKPPPKHKKPKPKPKCKRHHKCKCHKGHKPRCRRRAADAGWF
jgi:hypothetical protein